MTTGANQATATSQPEFFTQARIRLNEEGAELLWRLVLAEEKRLMDHRPKVIPAERPLFIDALRCVRRVKDELERTIIEQGWDQ